MGWRRRPSLPIYFGLRLSGPPTRDRAADEAMEIYRLTAWVAMGDDARTVTHTQLSWIMCMRWRPRRAEDGV